MSLVFGLVWFGFHAKPVSCVSSSLLREVEKTCRRTWFTVVELGKRRRRVVQDTISANVLAEEPIPVRFRPLGEMLLQATKARWGATIDFAAFYYQFPLDVAVRRFFTVRSGEHYYVPLRLPMGFKASASIAHSVTVHLMVQASPANLFTDPYIDGILVFGNAEA